MGAVIEVVTLGQLVDGHVRVIVSGDWQRSGVARHHDGPVTLDGHFLGQKGHASHRCPTQSLLPSSRKDAPLGSTGWLRTLQVIPLPLRSRYCKRIRSSAGLRSQEPAVVADCRLRPDTLGILVLSLLGRVLVNDIKASLPWAKR